MEVRYAPRSIDRSGVSVDGDFNQGRLRNVGEGLVKRLTTVDGSGLDPLTPRQCAEIDVLASPAAMRAYG